MTNISSNGLQNNPDTTEIQQFHRKRDLSSKQLARLRYKQQHEMVREDRDNLENG